MNRMLHLLLGVVFVTLLSGCGKKEEAPAPQPVPPAVVAELEKQRDRADREQAAKEQEQKKREHAEARADFWMTLAGGAFIGIVASVLVGVAIGSSARKKAGRGHPNE